MNTRLADGIDWVGYVDWNVRDFHGYQTDRGSTYNAYLVRDEQTALIDTVKAPYATAFLERVAALTDPGRIAYLVCNHAEPDHSGALPALVAACPRAEVVCDERCREALRKHYDAAGWRFRIVATGQRLPLGRRSLQFLETPMVHWPESMATYVPEERLLFSMDAFGQHYASGGRFDDEEPWEVLLAEAKTYYANIVMLYGRPIARVMQQAEGLELGTIAPSHGVIWRRHVGEILEAYRGWTAHRPRPKALVLYDTMWGSTAAMAAAVTEGALETGAEVRQYAVRAANLTVLATELLDAAALACGSATLNNTLMPQMAAVLTYYQGLKPMGKAGFAFGSYGWSKGGAAAVEGYLRAMKVDLLRPPLEAQFVPTAETLAECRAAGRRLGEEALARHRAAQSAGAAAG